MNRSLMDLHLLRRSLEEAPVVARGDYDYLVHPLTDGVPRVQAELLEEAAVGLEVLLGGLVDPAHGRADLCVTAEAMGLPLVARLAGRTGIPYVIARKRSYGLPGELELDQVTGYSRTRLHLNDVEPGDRVVVVDDLVSTGGTLRALVAGIRQAGAQVLAVAAVVTKQEDLGPLARELDCPVGALAAVRIAAGPHGKRVEVTGTDVRQAVSTS